MKNFDSKKIFFLTYLAQALIFSSGCSDSEAYHHDYDDPIETWHLLSETYCAQVEECGAPDGWDYENCIGILDVDEEGASRLRENIESGFALYSPEAAQDCLDAIVTRECPITPQIVSPPHQAIDLDLDGACNSVVEYRSCIGDHCDSE